MDTSSTKAPRGRPRLMSEEFAIYLRNHWAGGFSRHDRTNAVHMFHALRQFISDPRFAWLCSDVAPNGDRDDSRGHLRRTILTELGRVQDEDVREQLALDLCARKPTTREAVAQIRAYRLGRLVAGTAHHLAKAWGATLLQYLAAHPAMELEEISRALALLERWVDSIVGEED